MSFTSKFNLTDPNGIQHNILLEASTPEELLPTVQAFLDAGFVAFKTVTATAAPANGKAEAQVAPEQAKPGQLHSRFQVAVIEVEPQASGNAKVSFYGDDKIQPINKYPYINNTYKPATWVKKFADVCAFEPKHFMTPGRYAVRADVEVRYGNPNTQGNLYKNVAAITPAPGVGMQEVTTFEVSQPEPEDVPF